MARQRPNISTISPPPWCFSYGPEKWLQCLHENITSEFPLSSGKGVGPLTTWRSSQGNPRGKAFRNVVCESSKLESATAMQYFTRIEKAAYRISIEHLLWMFVKRKLNGLSRKEKLDSRMGAKYIWVPNERLSERSEGLIREYNERRLASGNWKRVTYAAPSTQDNRQEARCNFPFGWRSRRRTRICRRWEQGEISRARSSSIGSAPICAKLPFPTSLPSPPPTSPETLR